MHLTVCGTEARVAMFARSSSRSDESNWFESSLITGFSARTTSFVACHAKKIQNKKCHGRKTTNFLSLTTNFFHSIKNSTKCWGREWRITNFFMFSLSNSPSPAIKMEKYQAVSWNSRRHNKLEIKIPTIKCQHSGYT